MKKKRKRRKKLVKKGPKSRMSYHRKHTYETPEELKAVSDAMRILQKRQQKKYPKEWYRETGTRGINLRWERERARRLREALEEDNKR